MKAAISHYKIFVKKDTRTGTKQSCYSSYVPELGISTDGDTLEEVLKNTNEIIEFHLQCLLEEGEEVPVIDPTESFIFDLGVKVPKKVAAAR